MAAIPLHDDGTAITYQLDDGRQVKVARDAALRMGAPLPPSAPPASPPSEAPDQSALGISQPLAPPVGFPRPDLAGPAAPGPAWTAGDTAALEQMTPSPPAPTSAPTPSAPTGAPQPQPAPHPARGPAPRAQRPAPAPAQAPRGKYFGEVVAAGEQAEAMMQEAIADRAVAEQAANQRIVNTLDERNAELNRIREEQQKAQQASMAEIERRSKSVDAAIEDYSKTSIDPNRLSKSMSTASKAGLLFFQALAGLGQALKGDGGRNPAIDLWLQQIDKDIRLQMDARDQKRDHIGQMKDALARFQDLAQTRQGMYSIAMAAETDRAAKMLEQIAAQSKLDTVRANALESAAMLRQQSASFKGEWAKAEFQADQQARSLQEQIRSNRVAEGQRAQGLALDRQRFEYQKQKDAQDRELAFAQLDAQGRQGRAEALRKADEELQEKAIYGSDGNIILNPAGQKLVEQANQIEAAAASEADPARAQALREQAALMRTEAQVSHGLKGRNADHAAKLSKTIKSGQDALTYIDEIKKLREQEGGRFIRTTEGQRAMQSIGGLLALSLKEMYQLGALDKGSAEYLDKITGGDPAKLTAGDITSAFGSTPIANLDAVAQAIERSTASTLRYEAGYKGTEFRLQRVRPSEETPAEQAFQSIVGGKTQEQLAEGAEPGLLRRGAEYITGGGLLYTSSAERAEKAAGGEFTSPYGLDMKAQAGVDTLTSQLRSPDSKVAVEAAQKLIAAAKTDPSKALAIAATVRDQAPEVYDVFKRRLPKEAVQAAEKRAAALSIPGVPGGGEFSTVTGFAPDSVAAMALQPNAEGRRVAEEVLAATKSTDPKVQRAAAQVMAAIRERQAQE